MNFVQLQAKRKSLNLELATLVQEINSLPKGCCQDCKYYDQAMCLKYMEQPPAHFVREVGQCDSWQHDHYPNVLGDLSPEAALQETV